MSKESRRNNYNSVNTEVKEARENKEEKFVIKNLNPVEFKGVGKIDYRRSLELCTEVNKIFRGIYADFEGSTFEIGPDGDEYICLYFNHNVRDDSDKIVAFSQFNDGTYSSNELVNRVKRQSRRNRLGNQYRITKFGREGLEFFIKRRMWNNNGKVIWDKCYTDVAESQQYFNAQQAQKVYTKVSFIDPGKIYEFINGDSVVTGEDENGKEIVSKVEYKVSVHQVLSNPNGYYGMSRDYLLKIDQINKDELDRILKDAGFGSYSPFGIVSR